MASEPKSTESPQPQADATRRGRLLIFSGPSGAGKTTVLRGVMSNARQPLRMSVSATTRPPRPGEENGVDYHFLTSDEFDRRRESGDFLECFEVFGRGYWYGTLRETVSASLDTGQWVVLEIDVQGRAKVVEQYPDAVTFFVRPESLEILEQRLRDRGTENEETIQRRLEVARHEWPFANEYNYEIINHSIEHTVDDICSKLDELVTET